MDFEIPRTPAPTAPHRGHWWMLILLILVVMVFSLQLRQWLDKPSAASVQPRPVVPRGDLAADEKTTIHLFEQASPSVVFITSTELRRSLFRRGLKCLLRYNHNAR